MNINDMSETKAEFSKPNSNKKTLLKIIKITPHFDKHEVRGL